MPRDAGDDAYEELAKILAERETEKIRKEHAKKMARRKPYKPGKRCRSCRHEQKYHARSRAACGASEDGMGYTEVFCKCLAFNP